MNLLTKTRLLNNQPNKLLKLPPIIRQINNIINENNFTLNFDGCCKGNPGPSGIGVVIYNNGTEIFSKSKYIGDQTNNQSEYNALILGLQCALKLNITDISVFGDSLLVIQQTNGVFRVKNEKLIPLYETINDLKTKFNSITFKHVYRDQNKRADKLANIGLENNQYKSDYELGIVEID